MLNALRAAVLAAVWLSLAAPCLATDAASVPEAKRTTLGLYLTSEEVPSFLAEKNGRSLFVDVRAPEELAASGVATAVDANVPLFLLPGADGKPQPNRDFVAQVTSRMAAKGLTKHDAVIVMCRTGRRSALAASLLGEFGFAQVYSVIDGYEGDGPGMKGWKGAGLPWHQAAAPAQPN
jgi:rhodanese-related sulfurtransferase